MLGLSRWAGTGGSYRTVQRFLSTVMPWATLFWVFFRQHLYCPGEIYLLVGDEVVVTKAGNQTYGLDRFFPVSLASRCQGSLLRAVVRQHPATALIPDPRRTSRAQRRRKSRQAGQSGREAAALLFSQAPSRASQGQQEHPESCRGVHSRSCHASVACLAPCAGDGSRGLVDLRRPRRALRESPRPRDGAAERPAPDFQAPA